MKPYLDERRFPIAPISANMYRPYDRAVAEQWPSNAYSPKWERATKSGWERATKSGNVQCRGAS
jgi:hypothetical protein